jgi:hypothetical protein
LGRCTWQTHVHFIELGPGGGEHQKDKDHQQNINEWNQIDFRFNAVVLSKFQNGLSFCQVFIRAWLLGAWQTVRRPTPFATPNDRLLT